MDGSSGLVMEPEEPEAKDVGGEPVTPTVVPSTPAPLIIDPPVPEVPPIDPTPAAPPAVPALPDPVKFKLVIEAKGLIFGMLLDLAIEILFHLFGIAIFDTMALVRAVALGSAIGIVTPTLGRTVGMWFTNKQLREAKAEMQGGPA